MTGLVPLAILMGVATYASRALPLLAPGFQRVPARAMLYLRLVGPSVLAALAAVNVLVAKSADGPTFHVGWEWLSVALCVAVVGVRRSLFIGLVLAAATIAVLRASGVAPLP
jgi:branched-subunit amino acid transport protein